METSELQELSRALDVATVASGHGAAIGDTVLMDSRGAGSEWGQQQQLTLQQRPGQPPSQGEVSAKLWNAARKNTSRT